MKGNPGVLLLNGEWGCGKTHLIKEIADEYRGDDNSTVEIVIVSLFGVDSITELESRIKSAILKWCTHIDGKKEQVAKNVLSGLSVIVDAVGAIVPGVTAAKSVLSINPTDFIEIEKTIGDKKFILVFDDFERNNSIGKDVVLGFINDLSENKGIKVVLIASTLRIQEGNDEKEKERFNTYQEKVICRTVCVKNDERQLISHIIDGYVETEEGYQQFLKDNSNMLAQVFTESRSNNIRIFKYILFDFERIYKAWNSTEISQENLPFVLYTFAADYFKNRLPKHEKNDQAEHDSLLLVGRKENEQFALHGSHSSYFLSISAWISSGDWKENEFVNELQQHYGRIELTPEQAVRFKNFWDLSQSEIEQGLPKLINQAYAGDLAHDDLVDLLSKLYWLKGYGISFPCEVDYSKILFGLKERLNKIKQGTIEEPHIRMFLDRSVINTENEAINDLLEKMDAYVSLLKNRRALIEYIKNPRIQSRYIFSSQRFYELDDEIRDVFLSEYAKTENGIKRDLAQCILKVTFYDSALSEKKHIERSIGNYSFLLNEIEKMKNEANDCITAIIHSSLIEKLTEARDNLKQYLPAEQADNSTT